MKLTLKLLKRNFFHRFKQDLEAIKTELRRNIARIEQETTEEIASVLGRSGGEGAPRKRAVQWEREIDQAKMVTRI